MKAIVIISPNSVTIKYLEILLTPLTISDLHQDRYHSLLTSDHRILHCPGDGGGYRYSSDNVNKHQHPRDTGGRRAVNSGHSVNT